MSRSRLKGGAWWEARARFARSVLVAGTLMERKMHWNLWGFLWLVCEASVVCLASLDPLFNGCDLFFLDKTLLYPIS